MQRLDRIIVLISLLADFSANFEMHVHHQQNPVSESLDED